MAAATRRDVRDKAKGASSPSTPGVATIGGGTKRRSSRGLSGESNLRPCSPRLLHPRDAEVVPGAFTERQPSRESTGRTGAPRSVASPSAVKAGSGRVIRRETPRETPVNAMTDGIVPLYRRVHPGPHSGVPRVSATGGVAARVLTEDEVPASNRGRDNRRGDLIVRVGDVLADDAPAESSLRIGAPSAAGAHYEVRDLLGRGAFAQVLKCVRVETNEAVAVKVVRRTSACREAALREAALLRDLRKRSARTVVGAQSPMSAQSEDLESDDVESSTGDGRMSEASPSPKLSVGGAMEASNSNSSLSLGSATAPTRAPNARSTPARSVSSGAPGTSTFDDVELLGHASLVRLLDCFECAG